MGEIVAEELMTWDKLQGIGNGGGEEKILVLVRLRPLSEKETLQNEVADWECINATTILYRNSIQERSGLPTAYSFDRVFRGDNTTRDVYDEGIRDIALSVVGGINSTIFAYGQTSSGKTYTMNGITEYTAVDVYDYIKKHEEREFVLKFSAVEIYNEVVRDLLATDGTSLRLLDDPEKGTIIEKLTEETLRDWSHLRELLSICEAQRRIGETLLNETSSRSHQILRLSIESSAREFIGKGNSTTLAACVNFVDLAGSERASQALSVGQRLKEGCHINRSLLTLGTVIRKLSKGRQGHVNYRDSKLTRILQPSLGGNARTAIICTLSPARSHVEQSRNTLLFASCAKEVSTNAQVNVVMSDKALVKHLQKEVARLESELRTPAVSSSTCDHGPLLRKKDAQIQQLEKENRELKMQRDLANSRIADLLHAIENYKTSSHEEAANEGDPIMTEDNSQDNCSSDRSQETVEPLLGGYGEDSEDISQEVKPKQGTPDDEPFSPSTSHSEETPMLSRYHASKPQTPSSRGSNNGWTCVESEAKIQELATDGQSLQSGTSGSSMLRRSRSCRAALTMMGPNETTPTTVLEQNFSGTTTNGGSIPRKQWKLPPVIYGALATRMLRKQHSVSSDYSSFVDESSSNTQQHWEEEIPTLGSFVAGLKEMAKTEQQIVEEKAESTREEEVDLKNWPARFNRLRKQIMVLWDACNVPLVHRTYFFLLIKQDSTDPIYMEVENRRLTFLKEMFDRGNSALQDGRLLTLASSKKALQGEREMLSRLMCKKYREEERIRTYVEWGISVSSKKRRLQLAQRLWSETESMDHVAKSAAIVAKLIGFFDHGLALEETLGLRFAPPPRRSFNWRNSVTSLL